MRNLCLLAALILWSCVRNPPSPQAPIQEGEVPVFPHFSGHAVKVADQPDIPYELDGATLRALLIALNDFLPSPPKNQPCWNRPEAYRYRVIRQDNIIYIRIHANPTSCEGKFLMLDSGVSYAITAEGRILRRLFTGEPDWDSGSEVPDGGASHGALDGGKDAGEPDLASVLGTTWAEPRPFLPRKLSDGGIEPAQMADGGFAWDGGGSSTPAK